MPRRDCSAAWGCDTVAVADPESARAASADRPAPDAMMVDGRLTDASPER
jgi:hypothetical protein